MVDDIREQLTAEYPADQLICDGTVADVSQNCASNRCAPRVKQYEACYKHKTSGEYVWGQYKNNTSYDEVNVGMSSCNRLEIKKVDSSENVLTGATVTITGTSYNKDDQYELISDKGQDDCYVEMLVPKTDYNINRLVLVVMSLFAIIGLGYIIYSHYLRTHK